MRLVTTSGLEIEGRLLAHKVHWAHWPVEAGGQTDGLPLQLSIASDSGAECSVTLPGTATHVWSLARPSKGTQTVKVRLTTSSPIADTILAYLSEATWYSAETMAEWADEAEGLLYRKFADPYAAAVGAYLLLRLKRHDSGTQWTRVLADNFGFLPDGCVIYASQLINERRAGTESMIRTYLLEAVRRGLPVYTEGVRLLLDGLQRLGPDGITAREELLKDAGVIVWDAPVTTIVRAQESSATGISDRHIFDIALGAE